MPRDIYVRVAEPHMSFTKDDLTENDEEYVRIHVHGFDELGDAVCPVFKVPMTKEVNNAINNEEMYTYDEKGTKALKFKGRLIEVDEDFVDQFPQWLGHPTQDMTVEEIATRILAIREQQLIGDKVVGKVRKPYRIDRALFTSDHEYLNCVELVEPGTKVQAANDLVKAKELAKAA